ncbi:MAG TPA: hypothetical protein VMV72_07485 [Verrucomicrobiae bacterium]|nr:hypothetical protein [Verrucomicrobiae bacterium]
MKRPLAMSLCGAVFALAGCSSMDQMAVLSPVGPAPTQSSPTTGHGSLQVYSANAPTGPDFMEQEWTWQSQFYSGDLLHSPAHSDYAIYNQHGTLIKWVRNARNPYDPKPTIVSLPPGSYQIEAATDGGESGIFPVRVPVVIKSGQTTQLHLGDGWQPNLCDTHDFVRLPNGDLAGWPANP